MSLDALSAARKITTLAPRNKFVLMALSDYANDDGFAWPSYKSLAEWTCLGRKTIYRALIELEEAGVIASTQRVRENGSWTSKEYKLLFLAPGVIQIPPRCQSDTPPGVNVTSPEPPYRTPKKNLKPLSADADERADASLSAKKKQRASASPSAQPEHAALVDAWNANRGSLPEVKTISKTRVRALDRYLRTCEESGLDPIDTLVMATRVVAADEWWVKKKIYGLDNLLAGDKVFARAEAAPPEMRVGEDAVTFRKGMLVWWLQNPNQPKGKREYGVVRDVDGDNVFVYRAEQRGSKMRVVPDDVMRVLARRLSIDDSDLEIEVSR